MAFNPLVSRRRALAAAAAALLPGIARVRAADAYPSRPVRLIVPFAAGGPSDIIARILADALSRALGQSIVIENRGGGGANIGLGLAARAEPDGYTLLLTTSAIVINPALYQKIPFDPIKDFAPISDVAVSPQLLVVKPDYATSLADIIAKAKAAPGALNYSSPGIGTQAQLTVELLKLKAGIDIVHVPFVGGPASAQAVLSGATQLGTSAVPTTEPMVQNGLLRGIAVSGQKRWPSLPDTPTLEECGFPGFVTDTFAALFAPAGTPQPIIDLLARETANAFRPAEAVARARNAGFDIVAGPPESLRARVAKELAENREIIAKAGIVPR